MYLLFFSDKIVPDELGDKVKVCSKMIPGLDSFHLFCGTANTRFDFDTFLLTLEQVKASVLLISEKKGEDIVFVANGELSFHVMSVMVESILPGKEGVLSPGKEMDANFLNSLLSYHSKISGIAFERMCGNTTTKQVGKRNVVCALVSPSPRFSDSADSDAEIKLWREDLGVLLDIKSRGNDGLFPRVMLPKPQWLEGGNVYTSLAAAPPFISLFFRRVRLPENGAQLLEISGPSCSKPTKRIVVRFRLPESALLCYFQGGRSSRQSNAVKKRNEPLRKLDSCIIIAEPKDYQLAPLNSYETNMAVTDIAEFVSNKKRKESNYFNSGLMPIWRAQLEEKWRIGRNSSTGQDHNLEEILPLLRVTRLFFPDPYSTVSSIENLAAVLINNPPDVILFSGTMRQKIDLRAILAGLPPLLFIDLVSLGYDEKTETLEAFIAREQPVEVQVSLGLETKFDGLQNYPLSSTAHVMGVYLHKTSLMFPDKLILVPHPASDRNNGKGKEEKKTEASGVADVDVPPPTLEDGMYNEFPSLSAMRESLFDDEASNDSFVSHFAKSVKLEEDEEEAELTSDEKATRGTGGLNFRSPSDIGLHNTIIKEVDLKSFYPSIIIANSISTDKHAILPQLLAYLLDERNKEKKTNPKGPRQEALKLLANKVYGVVCLINKEKGRQITAEGRRIMANAKNVFEASKMGRVVYIDTDALFVGYLVRGCTEEQIMKIIRSSFPKKFSPLANLAAASHYNVEVKRTFSRIVFCRREKCFYGQDADTKKLISSSLENDRRDWPAKAREFVSRLLFNLIDFLPEVDLTDDEVRGHLFAFIVQYIEAEWTALCSVKTNTDLTNGYAKRKKTTATGRLWPPPSYEAKNRQGHCRDVIPHAALRKEFLNGYIPAHLSVLPFIHNETGERFWDTSSFLAHTGKTGSSVDLKEILKGSFIAPSAHILCSLVEGIEESAVEKMLCESICG